MSERNVDPVAAMEDAVHELNSAQTKDERNALLEAIAAVRELVEAARQSQQVHGELCDADLPGSWDAWKRLGVALDPFNAALSEPQA